MNPDFLHELKKRFTGNVRVDAASKILYSTDASIYQIEPMGVAFPKTQEDLHAAVELAAKYKIPILPRGAGTSLAGQAIGSSLILDCSRWLNNIVEINPGEHYAIVEPGVVLSNLNNAVARYGLQYGPDPASAERATMGGVIGNNATGAHSILYGMAADHLLSADVILADGSLEVWEENGKSKLSPTALAIREKYSEAIEQNFPKSWRNSAGYRLNYLLPWSPSAPPQWVGQTYPANLKSGSWNLAPLLAGSEGTLAVMRRLKLNLVPKPKHTVLGILAYEGIPEACDAVPDLLKHNPSAIELIPQMILRLARTVPAYGRQMGWVRGDPPAALVVEFSGERPSALKDAVGRLGNHVVVVESGEDQAQVWNIRRAGLGILDSMPQSARPIAFIEDCAIPVERLGRFVREVQRILDEHGTYGGFYAHASAGCLHIRPVLDLKTSEGKRALRSIAEQTLALTLKLGGSMSSEHGDGIARGEWLKQTYGDELVEAMRKLKQAADPHGLLNPNKMFDAPPMDSHLRYDVNSRAQGWVPAMDFSRNGGLVTAIEQCNGQGVCRKSTGVMCPSFQATREEMHATRGRANLLRAMISPPMSLRGASEVSDEAISSSMGRLLRQRTARNDVIESVAQALDLCLACKGCKAECPSGVDMAKLKYAFENEYYKAHRRPLRDYIFGYFHIFAAVASALAPASNAIMQIPAIRNMTAKVLGITPHRPFPKFQGDVILSHGAAKGLSSREKIFRFARNDVSKVIFLSDPFGHYIEPQVERAALDILALCGYEVYVLPVIGAGAMLMSKGMLDAAKRHAGKVLDALDQADPGRESVTVGIEPPEIYTLKHDYVDLLPARREEIVSRASMVWLLDEFLVRSDEIQKLRVANISKQPNTKHNPKTKILFQPHCHQRAERSSPDGQPIGTQATVELLRACGFEVEELDTGCCGMAGTFGYEVEHYDLSMKVGELKLFPLLRKHKSEGGKWLVVSTGAACRMQIQQGVALESVHPLILIADLFGAESGKSRII